MDGMDPRIILFGAAIMLLAIGTVKVAHGVKKGIRAIDHSVHHLIHHPVDSVKHGAATR